MFFCIDPESKPHSVLLFWYGVHRTIIGGLTSHKLARLKWGLVCSRIIKIWIHSGFHILELFYCTFPLNIGALWKAWVDRFLRYCCQWIIIIFLILIVCIAKRQFDGGLGFQTFEQRLHWNSTLVRRLFGFFAHGINDILKVFDIFCLSSKTILLLLLRYRLLG